MPDSAPSRDDPDSAPSRDDLDSAPSRDDLTWLETDRSGDIGPMHAQLAAIERLAHDRGLSALARAGRHIETFEPCA